MATNPYLQFIKPQESGETKEPVNPYEQFIIKDSAQETEDPYADDSAWDFSGERTLPGRFLEGNKAVPRQFLTTALSGIGGIAVQQAQRKKIQEKLLSNLDEYPTAKRLAKYSLKTATNPNSIVKNIADFAYETGTGKEVADVPVAEKVLEGAVYSINYLNNDSVLKGDEKYADLWTTKLGGGAGSLGAFVLAGIGGPATLLPFAGGSGAFEQYQRIEKAKEDGIDISLEDESLALGLGSLIGLSEAFTPLRLLRAIPKNIPVPEKKKILKAFTDYFKTNSGEILKTGAGEGTQEVGASLAQSFVEMGYNPNAELPSGESLFDDFTIGAVLGSGAKAGSNIIQQRRFNAMSDVEIERERKAIEWENAQNALIREKIVLMRQQRELEKSDPVAFAQASKQAREQAFKVAPPSEEEVKQFNAPSAFGPVATPSAFGELYALRTIGSLGQSFPTNTNFSVTEIEGPETAITNPDGTQGVQKKPLFTVTDIDGNQYGQPLADAQAASSMASTLNKEIQSKGVRSSILDTLMVSPQGYTPEQADKLFRYGFRVLSPDSNRITFAALNEAAGTTTENGYIEDLPLESVASAKEVRNGRFEVQMPDGTQRYITGLTASQELNLKRLQEGLPAATTFDISEARDALGGDVGRLALPGVSGIQDSLNYGAKVIDGKPVVISEANEVITQRRTTASEKVRAGVDEDGKSVLPDYIEFKTFDEAKRYAGRLNQRAGTSRVLPIEILDGKEDIASEIKGLLDVKNIDAEIGSPELNQLVKAFTGAETFSDMTVNDQKLFYNRLRNLPKFNERTKVPVFKQKLFTPEQFVEVARFANQNGFTPSKAYVGAVMGLDKSDPNYDAATESLLDEIKRQNNTVDAEQRRFEEEVLPLREELKKVLESFGLSSDMLNLGTRLYDRDTGEDITATNEDGSEGYFDPAFEEIVMAVDAIDIEGNKTQEQRLDELKGVMSHEVIHALRAMGMFTQKEYSILETAVLRTIKPNTNGLTYLQWARRPRSQGGYFEDRPTVQVEEAIADMFRDFITNRKLIGGKPRNLMERIINFFQKLRNMVEGYGFKTFSDVFAAVESGEIGRRQRAEVVTKEDGTQELVGPVRSLRKTEEMREKYQRMLPGRYQKFGDIFGQGPTVTSVDVPEETVPTENGRMADFDPAALEGAEVRQSRKAVSGASQTLPDTIDVDGVQRPTTNSNGQQIDDTEENVRNFWKWFGDSKMVDGRGRPIVYYHGTKNNFDAFKGMSLVDKVKKYFRVMSSERGGDLREILRAKQFGTHFFTDNAELASDYALMRDTRADVDNAPNVIPVYLKLERPVIIDLHGQRDGTITLPNGKQQAIEHGGLKNWLLANRFGYSLAEVHKADGFISRNVFDSVNPADEKIPGEYEVIVTFDPKQSKSAISNTGAYSSKDDRLRYSRKDIPAVIDVNGKERPTTNNKGQVIFAGNDKYTAEEGIRNFWRGFDDSKIVDSDGRPKQVYHATRKNFDVFGPQYRELGWHFGASPEQGQDRIKNPLRTTPMSIGLAMSVYGIPKEKQNEFWANLTQDEKDNFEEMVRNSFDEFMLDGKVMPVYLSIQNPIYFPKDIGNWRDMSMLGYYLTLDQIPRAGQQDIFTKAQFKRFKNDEDVRNALMKKGYDGIIYQNAYEDSGADPEAYIVFEDSQIKSSIGNQGSFSRYVGDINYSRKSVPGASKDLQGQGRVLFEVAPSPENKVRAGVWSGMPKADKVAITRKIGPMAIREVAGIFDIPMSAFKQPILGQGLFEGVVNPNQILGIKTNKVRPEQAIQFASALGYVLEQKAMVVADGRMTGKETSLVRIYTKGDAMAVADRLYDLIKQEVGDFGGYSAFNDHIDIMNFSSIDSRELASRFADIINEKASDVDVTVRHAKIQSAYIEERKYASSIYSGAGRANREGLERRLDSARSRIIQRLESEISSATGQPTAATGTGEVRFSRRVRGSSGVLQQPRRPYQKDGRTGKSLQGLPRQIKVDGSIIEFDAFGLAQKVAERYMRKAGLPYSPPTKYVSVDPAMSVSIAEEFERMQHDPQNPLVMKAYRQMMAETAAQYREIMKTGLKVEFIKGDDPYGNPRNAILDIVENNHFWVFSTRDGFGSNEDFSVENNPLLEETEFRTSNGEKMLANDLFRVVHDYFGHALPGVGFRATGEENAWRSHASMYTPLARRAMTSETRGQNSYVNFGPNGEFNRTASPADTIYADQKVGLMPEWVSTDTYETGAVMPKPEQAAPEQISQENLAEAVAKAEEDTKNTGMGAVPLYGKNASPEALYIAQNPEQAATLTKEDEVRYSRRNTPNYSPRARQIIDKNTPRPPDEPVGKSIINMMGFPETRDMWDGLRAGIFNRYARIERITRENQNLAEQLADVGSYAAIEMADRSRHFTAMAAAEGVPVYENGMFRVKDFYHKGKKIRGLIGLDEMLFSKEYGNMEELAQAYATAVRGERLNSEGKLTPVSPGELAELKKEVQKFINPETGNPIVLEWFDAWQDYNSNVVKFLRDTGVVDEAGAALWLKQSDYVPFYREDVNGNLVHPKVFGGLHTAGQFKAVGKSDKAINVDMKTAIFNNIDVAIAMGMKNVAQQRVIRDLEKLGLATMLRSGEQVGNRQSINFKVKGKQYTALIEDPLLYESLLPVSELDLGEFTEQVLSFPAETWRELITRNPDFGFANAFRDTVSAFMITGANIVPVLSSVQYFFAPLSKMFSTQRLSLSDRFLRDISELENMGIISGRGGYDLGRDSASVKKFYAKELKRRQSNTSWWKNPFIALWDALGRFTERTEAATRLAVYNDILKRTGNPAEAQYQAISVMNYARRGNNKILRFITKTVPFTNANLQGKDKLYQAVTGRIGARYVTDSDGNVSKNASRALNRAVFAGRALLMIASTVLYYAMVYDDDEYLTASPEMRDNYYILPITKGDVETGEPGLSLRLPIAFDVGSLFKVIPERIIALTMGEDSTRDFNQSMMRELKKQLFGGMPIHIKPIYEAYITNYESFTSRPVVPTFMENLEPEQQKTFYTNKAIEKVAEIAGVSPMRLEHAITGYFPGVGAYFLQILDSTARYLDGPEAQKPAMQWFQLPGIKRFFTTANQPGLVNQFYDLKDNVDGIVQTINRLENEGRDDELAVFYAKNGHMYEMRRELNSIERQIKQLRDERKIIEEMAIDQESKRVLIEEINMQINASLLTIPMLRQEAFGSLKEE